MPPRSSRPTVRRPTSRRTPSVAALVARLERTKSRFGAADAPVKRGVLAALADRRIAHPGRLLRLHESLCFLRAYPDDPALLAAVEAALAAFPGRVAALDEPGRLDETGLAGTRVYPPLSYAAARWLAARFPEAAEIDWANDDGVDALAPLAPRVTGLAAEDALVEVGVPYREWVRAARRPDAGSDLAVVLAALAGDSPVAAARQALYDALGLRVRWDLGDGPASRTRLSLPVRRVFFHRGPLRRWRGPIRRRLPGPRVPVRRARGAEAARILDAARAALAVRYRELHAFNFADPADVLVAELGRGVRLAWIGVLPARRLPLRAHYGYLLAKNGAPVGYGDASLVFDRVEVAYNVFETFRQGESAFMFVRLLAFLYQRFGIRAFLLAPYQLGMGNDEALASGAFWFYDKLGFRPHRADLRRLAAAERRRIRIDPGYRSPRATLARLAEGPVTIALGPRTTATLDIRRLVLRAAATARDDGAPSARLAARVARALGAAGWRGWPGSERAALEALAAVLALIPELAAWPAAERRVLVRAIRAKGGADEGEYLRRLGGRSRLRRRLMALAGEDETQSASDSSSPRRSSSRPK